MSIIFGGRTFRIRCGHEGGVPKAVSLVLSDKEWPSPISSPKGTPPHTLWSSMMRQKEASIGWLCPALGLGSLDNHEFNKPLLFIHYTLLVMAKENKARQGCNRISKIEYWFHPELSCSYIQRWRKVGSSKDFFSGPPPFHTFCGASKMSQAFAHESLVPSFTPTFLNLLFLSLDYMRCCWQADLWVIRVPQKNLPGAPHILNLALSTTNPCQNQR